jgi:hypothetical protein
MKLARFWNRPKLLALDMIQKEERAEQMKLDLVEIEQLLSVLDDTQQ